MPNKKASKQKVLTSAQVAQITRALEARIQEAGARHNREDSGMVQTIHDHAVSLGATCPAMIDEAKSNE